MTRFICYFILCWFATSMPVSASEYAVAHTFAPVLNVSDFGNVFGGMTGKKLKTDRCGQVRELEFIALPGTVFKLIKKLRFGVHDIYQVETDEYTSATKTRLYVDGRFLSLEHSAPAPRLKKLQTREEIVAKLGAAVGKPYVWGGNAIRGVPELAQWFYGNVSEEGLGQDVLAGLDCSGLLYYATGGWTPRNTSQLVDFGQGVEIAGKKTAEIELLLQPLDLVVWNGHVIIVLDQKSVIESRLECGKTGNGGVVITQLSQRLSEIMRARRPANVWLDSEKSRNSFVVRRWYAQP